MSSPRPEVRSIDPPHVVPGGRVRIHGVGFSPERAHAHRVYFGERRAEIARISEDTITAVVPEDALAEIPEVRVEVDGASSQPLRVSVAYTLADELQPVANPVFDRDKHLYVTLSGSRGEKVPVSVYRVGEDGEVEPYVSDIVNATGLAWGPEDCLYVSSREEGVVYRVESDRRLGIVADELGTATGIAFDPDGVLYVGDRRGTIFRVERNGEPRSFCRLPPSVSAYHLAFDARGDLFVTGPSLSSIDPVYRVDRSGEVAVHCGGFGRPQGMAFDAEGRLYVSEGLVGTSGIYRLGADGRPERFVASPPVVGLAFDGEGGIVVAGSSTVYYVEADIVGEPPGSR